MSRSRRLNVFKPTARARHVGTELDLTIERLGDEGQGMALWQGRWVFVENALPGERVLARIDSETRHGLLASCLRLLSEPAAQRIEPPCVHYTRCGGCQLQHIDPIQQVHHKQSVAQRRLHRQVAGHCWQEPATAGSQHYRHRTRLQVERRGERVVIGFRRQGSHQLVDIDICLQWQEPLARAVTTLRRLLPTVRHVNRIDEVSLACGHGGVIGACFRVRGGFSAADIEALAGTFGGEGWLLEVVDAASGRVLWRVGQPELEYPHNPGLRFGPADFTQANPEINARMLRDALDWLAPQPDDTVLELFAGLGNFSLPLARTGCTVRAYELSEAMVTRARALGAAAEDVRLTVEQADLFDAATVDALLSESGHCSKLLLDPPRVGARLVCRQLSQRAAEGHPCPRQILYVSCNSLALGGDLEPLLAVGYQPVRARVHDMFPHTSHFETLVLLECDPVMNPVPRARSR